MRETINNKSKSFVTDWHSVYWFIPVFENPVNMPTLEALTNSLTQKFGSIQYMSHTPQLPTQDSDLLGIALLDHPVYFEQENKTLPSQLILYGPSEFSSSDWTPMIISQFWDCNDKQGFASRCHYSLMASNLMSATLPFHEQYKIMADYADVILELFPDCIGIYWPHSQRLTPRETFLSSNWNSSDLHFLDGGINIRFFNIEGSNDMLFDTLGFTAIGLPDLQCHCKGLKPNDMVTFLYNLASYIYTAGDVIEDGNTVEGIDGGKWFCHREDSLVEPTRMVLDICPAQYAAGNR